MAAANSSLRALGLLLAFIWLIPAAPQSDAALPGTPAHMIVTVETNWRYLLTFSAKAINKAQFRNMKLQTEVPNADTGLCGSRLGPRRRVELFQTATYCKR